MDGIVEVLAREILDSRGQPTLEVEVRLESGSIGRAGVPSGASTGTREALELRDGGTRFGGRGVLQAVKNVEQVLGPALLGMDATAQATIDARLVELDGTPEKSKLGANALLGLSLAVARAAASSHRLPLYRYLGGAGARILPVPMFNIVNGGQHASNNVDIQEFMIVPLGAETYSEALRMGAETYQSLKGVLKAAGLSTAVGDEGGFAPDLACNAHALDVIMEAIKQAGYRPGSEIALALDVAATALVEGGKYRMAAEDPPVRDATSMTQYYEDLVGQYPIVSIEDGMGEDDTEGWKTLTAVLGSRIQLVGDDNFVTHPAAIAEGAKEGIANAVLIKLNQIGTLTETFQAVEVARSAGFSQVVSHRSGETEDTSIADFTVAVGCGQIKSGAPCRSERVAKYNRLLRIEKELGSGGRFAGTAPYQYRSAAQR